MEKTCRIINFFDWILAKIGEIENKPGKTGNLDKPENTFEVDKIYQTDRIHQSRKFGKGKVLGTQTQWMRRANRDGLISQGTPNGPRGKLGWRKNNTKISRIVRKTGEKNKSGADGGGRGRKDGINGQEEQDRPARTGRQTGQESQMD